MPVALGRWGLSAPERHRSYRAKSHANTKGRLKYEEHGGEHRVKSKRTVMV
jgi:hypothetical protein